MLTFSSDPEQASREMDAVLYLLASFGYIDGHFDKSEREYIDELILQISESVEPDDSTSAGRSRRSALVDRLDRKLQKINEELKAMWDEPTAEGERAQTFVRARVKLRCLEIFEGIPLKARKTLMEAIDELLAADGVAHPEEVQVRDELMGVLIGRKAAPQLQAYKSGDGRRRVFIHPHAEWPRTEINNRMLTQLERHYSSDPDEFKRQLHHDTMRVERFLKILEGKRAGNDGTLEGHHTVDELAGRSPFLDGFVHVIPPTHAPGYELTVLGDLHGCYSCLKSALMQSDFLGKIERFKKAPHALPEPYLVVLGDYIDRGLYSYEGVLRGLLGLAAALPKHVILLRGNHEHYHERDGVVFGGVRPADAIDALKPYAPMEVFQAYRQLFESLPSMLLFGDMMLVHAGIPRDAAIREHYRDLSSLNHPDLRFQMMWSDPSTADEVPEDLQAASNRFAFGHEQARAFLHRMGVTTLIRGHEKVDAGFVVNIDEPDLRIITLFSAGGADNWDLPERSSYRAVTPTALTVRYRDGRTDIEPWVIDYKIYNDPDLNGFYAEE
ncbi:MAG: metallophosphoesterase [Deltaproteobacteria bacterium]|nr:metallophosphoesterase [Deltaproteobacteria bacterium]